MTRLLYLPDEETVVQLEVEISASQLCAAINAGLRPLPALRSSAAVKLTAIQFGGTVITAPAFKSNLPPKPAKTTGGLSRRQAQVHELASRGLTSGEIALLLHLSRRTVNYHLNQVKSRLRLEGSPQTEFMQFPLDLKREE